MRSLMRWLRSFTLIEMLVVIAIISILAGMLLPALAAARERARQADCKAKLSQIGKAIYLYSESNGEYYPYFTVEAIPQGTTTYPTDSLALLYPDLIAVPGVFRCMSTGDKPNITITKNIDSASPSYGTITRRSFGTDNTRCSYGYDECTGFRNSNPMMPIAADMDGSSIADPESVSSNHKGGQNVLCFDTHVEWKSINTFNHNNDNADNIYLSGDKELSSMKDKDGHAIVGDSDVYIHRNAAGDPNG